jgi:leucyl-tRNA synthetase
MAVPAHDQRDWEFANKFGADIIEVIHGKDSKINEAAYEGEGVMVNSGQFDGTDSTKGVEKLTGWLESKGLGRKAVNYKLKEWLISRQRYWGTPIPMIYCQDCGIVPVAEKDLPVMLPADVKLTGAGDSPLASHKEFVETVCPKCGKKARRETDTMDTFVDSSWYFSRYCDAHNDKAPFSKESASDWLPVDQYIGGIEHACMHLIYSRFWHKFMRDLGLVKCDEPYTNLLTQGMVTLGGSAMSKSRGNVVSPDEIIEKFGADTARLFILFAAPPEKQLDWSQDGLEGCWRFINRVWRLLEMVSSKEKQCELNAEESASASKKLLIKTNKTIKKITGDISAEHQFNTAISAAMELVNELYAYPLLGCAEGVETAVSAYKSLILLLAPFTPHVCEEIWNKLGHTESLSTEKWPEADPKYLVDDEIEIPIQINGKMRGKLMVAADITENDIRTLCETDEKLLKYFENMKIVKFIYVEKRIVNIIVK